MERIAEQRGHAWPGHSGKAHQGDPGDEEEGEGPANDESSVTTPIRRADAASSLVRSDRSTRIPKGTVATAAAAVAELASTPIAVLSTSKACRICGAMAPMAAALAEVERQHRCQQHKRPALRPAVALAQRGVEDYVEGSGDHPVQSCSQGAA